MASSFGGDLSSLRSRRRFATAALPVSVRASALVLRGGAAARGATFDIVCPQPTAKQKDQGSNNVKNGTSGERALAALATRPSATAPRRSRLPGSQWRLGDVKFEIRNSKWGDGSVVSFPHGRRGPHPPSSSCRGIAVSRLRHCGCGRGRCVCSHRPRPGDRAGGKGGRGDGAGGGDSHGFRGPGAAAVGACHSWSTLPARSTATTAASSRC